MKKFTLLKKCDYIITNILKHNDEIILVEQCWVLLDLFDLNKT